MIESRPDQKARFVRYWPLMIGGFAGPILAGMLAASMPLYAATAAAFFIAFFVSSWLCEPPRAVGAHRYARNLGASALGAVIAGLITYLLS